MSSNAACVRNQYPTCCLARQRHTDKHSISAFDDGELFDSTRSTSGLDEGFRDVQVACYFCDCQEYGLRRRRRVSAIEAWVPNNGAYRIDYAINCIIRGFHRIGKSSCSLVKLFSKLWIGGRMNGCSIHLLDELPFVVRRHCSVPKQISGIE